MNGFKIFIFFAISNNDLNDVPRLSFYFSNTTFPATALSQDYLKRDQ